LDSGCGRDPRCRGRGGSDVCGAIFHCAQCVVGRRLTLRRRGARNGPTCAHEAIVGFPPRCVCFRNALCCAPGGVRSICCRGVGGGCWEITVRVDAKVATFGGSVVSRGPAARDPRRGSRGAGGHSMSWALRVDRPRMDSKEVRCRISTGSRGGQNSKPIGAPRWNRARQGWSAGKADVVHRRPNMDLMRAGVRCGGASRGMAGAWRRRARVVPWDGLHSLRVEWQGGR